jgi:hypothetical protein
MLALEKQRGIVNIEVDELQGNVPEQRTDAIADGK